MTEVRGEKTEHCDQIVFPGGVTSSLTILAHQDRLYSFVSSVRLEAHVLWAGGLRLTWGAALARAGDTEEEDTLEVAHYRLELYSRDGEETGEFYH